ncbi:YeeE/YedE family protein [bacterium]|nr:YeeE/YedE family protein [bacterium]
MSLYELIFVRPWSFWAAGAGIGLFVIAFAWFTGKALGVSTGYGTCCGLASRLSFFRKKPYTDRWRLWFIAGIPLGGLASAALSGKLASTFQMGMFDTAVTPNPWAKGVLLIVGGALVGLGARWADGCPSGHSIVGVAQGARSSIRATVGFMVGGLVVTNLFFWLVA